MPERAIRPNVIYGYSRPHYVHFTIVVSNFQHLLEPYQSNNASSPTTIARNQWGLLQMTRVCGLWCNSS
jgi:hypothetical protein